MSVELPTQPEPENLMYKASPEEISLLLERMEEMANMPPQPMGIRTPGEKWMYEIQRKESC